MPNLDIPQIAHDFFIWLRNVQARDERLDLLDLVGVQVEVGGVVLVVEHGDRRRLLEEEAVPLGLLDRGQVADEVLVGRVLGQLVGAVGALAVQEVLPRSPRTIGSFHVDFGLWSTCTVPRIQRQPQCCLQPLVVLEAIQGDGEATASPDSPVKCIGSLVAFLT